MVARTLAAFGWEVSLTSPTRDGGVDIIGVTKDGSGLETTWAVECKRFSENHRRCRSSETTDRDARSARIRQRASCDFRSADCRRSKNCGTGSQYPISSIEISSNGGLQKRISALVLKEGSPNRLSRVSSATARSIRNSPAISLRVCVEKGFAFGYAAEQMSPGKKIVDQIDAAISTFDRVLVVLSTASIASMWVATEVRKAYARQKEERRTILFPVTLIPFEELKKWQLIDSDSGVDLAFELRSYLVARFFEMA